MEGELSDKLLLRVVFHGKSVLLDQVGVRKIAIGHQQLVTCLNVPSGIEDHIRLVINLVVVGQHHNVRVHTVINRVQKRHDHLDLLGVSGILGHLVVEY